MISRAPRTFPTEPEECGSASARGFEGASRLRSLCTARPEEDGDLPREAETEREPEEDREPEEEREAEELRVAEAVPDTAGTARRLQRSSPSAEKTFL